MCLEQSLIRASSGEPPYIPLSALEIVCWHVLLPASASTSPNPEQFQQLSAAGRHCCLATRAAGCVEAAQPSFLHSQQVRNESLCVPGCWPREDGTFPGEVLQAACAQQPPPALHLLEWSATFTSLWPTDIPDSSSSREESLI